MGGNGSTVECSDEEEGNSDNDTAWEDIDDEQSDYWLRVPDMLGKRCGHCSVTCFDDSILTMGGYAGETEYLSSAERYDPVRELWSPLPCMRSVRSGAVAALGPQGGCYVVGGSIDGTIGVNGVEMYDLREGLWHALPSLQHARGYLAGCIGRGEQLFVSGGLHCHQMVASIEVMDMRMNTWRLLEMEGDLHRSNENLSRACHQMFLT